MLHITFTLTVEDLIAALGEATAQPYFIYRLRDAMLSNPTGRRILLERPTYYKRVAESRVPTLSPIELGWPSLRRLA